MHMFSKRAKVMLVWCAAMPLLAGCDLAQESLVAAIAPVSANEVADGLRREIAQGKFVEASTRGARYLEHKRDAAGVVAWETARASAQAGKLDAAIRYAALAIEGGTVAGVDLAAEPLLAPVRGDSRFALLAAGSAAHSASPHYSAGQP